jgi:hypothetical protein
MEELSAESWEYARGYAGIMGTIPASFTTIIRGLMTDHESGMTKIEGANRYQVIRLIKSPSLFSTLYFACKALTPQVIRRNGYTSETEIVDSLSPFELAYLIGFSLLFRRAQGLCDDQEFSYIDDDITRNMNVGFLMGRAIPAIGAGCAMIEGTAPILALCTFLRHDAKGFKEYRRAVLKPGSSWDTSAELKRWGCHSLQVASVIVQTLGFGISHAQALTTSREPTSLTEESRITKDYRMAGLWRESIIKTLAPPTVKVDGRYYPSTEALNSALNKHKELIHDKQLAGWLKACKEDLPECQTNPQPSKDETTAFTPEDRVK